MIAIHTKFIGPSNTRAARIKAYVLGDKTRKTVTIGYHDEAGDLPSSTDAKYRMAAEMLADYYGWRHDGERVYTREGDTRGNRYTKDNCVIVPQQYELLSGGNGDGSYVFIFSPLATVQAAQHLLECANDILTVDELNSGVDPETQNIMDVLRDGITSYVRTIDDNQYIGRK